jgi:hypothetical protein
MTTIYESNSKTIWAYITSYGTLHKSDASLCKSYMNLYISYMNLYRHYVTRCRNRTKLHTICMSLYKSLYEFIFLVEYVKKPFESVQKVKRVRMKFVWVCVKS